MRLYLAPWQWSTGPVGSAWRAPAGSAVAVDLRSNVAAGTPAIASGVGLFQSETPPAGAVLLGDDPAARMSLARRNALADALRLPRAALPDASLAVILTEHVLGAQADPTGATRVKPLRMTGQGLAVRLKHFGEVYRAPLDKAHPVYAQTLAVRRADYARERARLGRSRTRAVQLGADPDAAEAAALDALRRWTGHDMRALGATEDELLPVLYLADGSRAPQTVLTESWPTDSTTISSGQDLPWTEELNDASVASGVLGAVSEGANCIVSCDTALSADDHSHSATYAITESATLLAVTGVVARYDAAVGGSNPLNAYIAYGYRLATDDLGRISKYVAGTETTLDTETGDPGATGTMSCTADGSAISGVVGSLPALAATDTAITGYLQCGAMVRHQAGMAHGAATLDTHTMSDIFGLVPARGSSRAMHRAFNRAMQ